ncbi:MAG: hypothetical protein J7M05_14585 [Anaerolineae bacterium]|nr:hypothetical protein [Anaerolineae bacterium]
MEQRVTLPRFPALHGWCNRLLRIDLSSGRIRAQEAAPYLPDYLGGRGIAARILWDEYPEPVDPFDPRNPLMIIPGALTGTPSPYSGRTVVAAFSPQSHPYCWFTRANIGLNWGNELKKAGYDGVIITGASETPVQILIQDDQVSILPADDLWGLDIIQTQDAIHASLGKKLKVMTIGPAGERLSRIATMQTGSTSVAGQGGFGAVMGSKKLKAISVVGTGKVPVANLEKLRWLYKEVGAQVRALRGPRRAFKEHLKRLNEELAPKGGQARGWACTAYCPTPCKLYLSTEGCAFQRHWEGGWACVSSLFRGWKGHPLYDWDFGLRGGFELNMYANALGLNHWELLVGIVPWLRSTNEKLGEFPKFNGRPVDWYSLDFWTQFLHDIAYRIGMGDALAEGAPRAASLLKLGEEIVRRYYTGWGYSGHWDGHAAFVNYIVYPFWIVGALHWAMDTRDPASDTHGYVQNVMYVGPFKRDGIVKNAPITWDHMRAIGERVYGRADVLDPLSGYEGKAIPAAYHAVRSVLKDSLPTDDQVFPLIYSLTTPDRFFRIGDIEGPDVDAHLFRAGTGVDWDTQELERAGERILNLERAITIRHWGRDRQFDERVIPSFEYDENWINPEIGVRMSLDRERFAPVMDEYYRLRGWDVQTGWPTRERLEELGLGDIYEAMIAGAKAARQRLPTLPSPEPVLDIHRYDPDRQDRLKEQKQSVP